MSVFYFFINTRREYDWFKIDKKSIDILNKYTLFMLWAFFHGFICTSIILFFFDVAIIIIMKGFIFCALKIQMNQFVRVCNNKTASFSGKHHMLVSKIKPCIGSFANKKKL